MRWLEQEVWRAERAADSQNWRMQLGVGNKKGTKGGPGGAGVRRKAAGGEAERRVREAVRADNEERKRKAKELADEAAILKVWMYRQQTCTVSL
jgi:hypothetical protein